MIRWRVKIIFFNFNRPLPIVHSRYCPSILFPLGLLPIRRATVSISLEVPAFGIGSDVDAAAVFSFRGVGIDDAFSSIRSSSDAAASALHHRDDVGFHGLEGRKDSGVSARGGGRGAHWRGGARKIVGGRWGR